MSPSHSGSEKDRRLRTPQEIERDVEQAKLEAEAVLLKLKRLEIETELIRLEQQRAAGRLAQQADAQPSDQPAGAEQSQSESTVPPSSTPVAGQSADAQPPASAAALPEPPPVARHMPADSSSPGRSGSPPAKHQSAQLAPPPHVVRRQPSRVPKRAGPTGRQRAAIAKPTPRQPGAEAAQTKQPPFHFPVPSPAPAEVDVERLEHLALMEKPAATPRRWIRRAGGVLLSAVAHVAVVLLLAAVTFRVSQPAPSLLVSASVADAEPLERVDDLAVEELAVDVPSEQLEPAAALPSADAGQPAIDLGGLAALAPVPGGTSDAAGAAAGAIEMSDVVGSSQVLMTRIDRGRASADFFGVKAGGRRFVFVVDGSKSMKGDRWKACVYELISAVGRLKKNQRFYVILFSEEVQPMFGGAEPEPFPVPPSEENLRRLVRWLEAYQLQPGAGPCEALKVALSMNPDAIYLLSDGRFSDETEEYLREHNRLREDFTERLVPKAAVHTIGFFSRSGQELLERIAKENGGTYRFVPPPSRK